jgi:hypothetical protein
MDIFSSQNILDEEKKGIIAKNLNLYLMLMGKSD